MTTDTCRIAASRLATLASALLVVASGPGCGASPGEADVERGARTEVGSPIPDRQPGLECEREQYPCAWADVDTAVFDRSLALGEEPLERMTADSVASAAAWLRGLSEVVRVDATDRALSFRLDRGGPVWVIAGDSEGGRVELPE